MQVANHKTKTQNTHNMVTLSCSAYALSKCYVSTSAWNDIIAAILKVWHQIESMTPPIEVNFLKEQSWQISPRSNLKWRNLRFFEESRQKEQDK